MTADSLPIGQPLSICIGSAIFPGNDAGKSFRLKRKEGDLLQQEQANMWQGTITNWRRVGFIAGTKDKARFFVLEPSDQYDEVLFEEFYVKGYFKIASHENNTIRARDAYRKFEPA